MLRAIARRLGLLGRSSRTTLFNFLVLSLFGYVVLWFALLPRFRNAVHSQDPFTASLGNVPWWLLYLKLALGLVWLWLTVRRINDQDRPGWIAIFPTGLPIAATLGLPVPDGLVFVVAVGVMIAIFLPGTIGPNGYGPDPRGWKSREHFLEQQKALGKR